MNSEKRTVIEIIASKHFKELLSRLIMRIPKSNSAAELIRKQGNTYFQTKDHNSQSHDEAWKLYSMSVATAESNSDALALAYSNRSAILAHMSKYEASIMDVDRALAITRSDFLRAKLLIRKIKCLYALERDEAHCVLKEAEGTVEKIAVSGLREQFDRAIKEVKFMLDLPMFHTVSNDKKSEMLKAIEKKHPINDFSSVVIRKNETYGRFLAASSVIKPGEVIYIEEPYIQCVNIKKMYAFCSHCFKTTWANIPCDQCSWTMFCSEECKNDAWEKYHDIECGVYACAKEDEGSDTSKQMAIRAMILALKEYGGIRKLEAQLLKWDECKDNREAFFDDGEVKGNGFKSMYMMSGHVSAKLFKKYKKDTARVLRSLGKNTSFFGQNFEYHKVESYANNENVLFLGALFLRLSKICEINSFQMWNNSYKCQRDMPLNQMCWMNECCSGGVYIAPITSLINHSCTPNANRCFSNNHKVILYAVQPINKGAQIFHSYQELFCNCERSGRREYLSHVYNFNCKCAACQGEWPLLKELIVTAKSQARQRAANILIIKSEYDHLIKLIDLDKIEFNEKLISNLAMGVEKSLEILPQPALYTIQLITCVSIVFDDLYGIWLNIPKDCDSIQAKC